jgi:hypothetical protein
MYPIRRLNPGENVFCVERPPSGFSLSEDVRCLAFTQLRLDETTIRFESEVVSEHPLPGVYPGSRILDPDRLEKQRCEEHKTPEHGETWLSQPFREEMLGPIRLPLGLI